MLAFKEQIGYLLSPLTGLDPEEITSLLEVPPEPGLGKYAFPCYILARSQKRPPRLSPLSLPQR